MSTYSDFAGLSAENTEQAVRQNVTAAISDRAIVNNCVSQKLKQQGMVHPELLHLNCNVHPLDSVSGKSREASRKLGDKGLFIFLVCKEIFDITLFYRLNMGARLSCCEPSLWTVQDEV